jgi:hypothetical protein
MPPKRARKTKKSPAVRSQKVSKSLTSLKTKKVRVPKPKRSPSSLPFLKPGGGKLRNLGAMATHHQVLRGSLLRGGK